VTVAPAHDVGEEGAPARTRSPEVPGESFGAEDVGLRAHERGRQALDRRRRQHERADGCGRHEDADRDRRGQPADLARKKRPEAVAGTARSVVRPGRELPQE
jgi:hypothetical protein